MAFAIQEPKMKTEWFDYLNEKKEKQGSFHIHTIAHPRFQVEFERIEEVYSAGKFVEYKGTELTKTQAILQIIAKYLIIDWKGVAIEENGETKDVEYDAETAFNIMRWGVDLSGASLGGWIMGKAKVIQTEADARKAEVVGKSENYTDGQSSENKQPKKPKKSST